MIQIIAIIKRATQGVTLPFLCKADDENFYYVKGMGSHAGHRSLLAEWIGGNLAKGLNVFFRFAKDKTISKSNSKSAI